MADNDLIYVNPTNNTIVLKLRSVDRGNGLREILHGVVNSGGNQIDPATEASLLNLNTAVGLLSRDTTLAATNTALGLLAKDATVAAITAALNNKSTSADIATVVSKEEQIRLLLASPVLASGAATDTKLEALRLLLATPVLAANSATSANQATQLANDTIALNAIDATKTWQNNMRTDNSSILTKLDTIGFKSGSKVSIQVGGVDNSDAAPVVTRAVVPTALTLAETNSAIGAGSVVPFPANPNRAYLDIQNPNQTGYMRYMINGTASSTTGKLLLPGAGFTFETRAVPKGIISIYSSVAGNIYVVEGV